MAAPGDEFIPKILPSEDHPDYFNILVDNCIKAYGKTFSDSIALDANGVVEKKMRVLIRDDARYQRETRMLSARRTIDEISEIQELRREVEIDEDDGNVEEGNESYDIRNREGKNGEATVKKPKKLFDKSQLDAKIKLMQMRRDVLKEKTANEETEGNALNIFFIPVTKEDFEKMQTMEISVGVGTGTDAYKADEEERAKSIMGNTNAPQDGELGIYGKHCHMEVIDGEETLVEDD